MVTYIRTYIHTYRHTYTHYIHTYIQTYRHTYIHTYTYIYMYVHDMLTLWTHQLKNLPPPPPAPPGMKKEDVQEPSPNVYENQKHAEGVDVHPSNLTSGASGWFLGWQGLLDVAVLLVFQGLGAFGVWRFKVRWRPRQECRSGGLEASFGGTHPAATPSRHDPKSLHSTPWTVHYLPLNPTCWNLGI